MKVILLGPPGSGEGTQGDFISSTFAIPKISTGEILRNVAMDPNHPDSQQVCGILNSGQLIPDDMVIDLVIKELHKSIYAEGFLLDGFPRTINQAKALHDVKIFVDHVINLQVSDDILVQRLSGRFIHQASGRVYHIEFNPPKKLGYDDITGEDLTQREDDAPEVVKHRLSVYREQTEPLVDWYKNVYNRQGDLHDLHFISIDASKPLLQVKALLLDVLQATLEAKA